jgi:hypothetical protein
MSLIPSARIDELLPYRWRAAQSASIGDRRALTPNLLAVRGNDSNDVRLQLLASPNACHVR